MELNFIRRLFYKKRKYYSDDFDWDNYTADSYKRRVTGDIEPEFATSSGETSLTFDPEKGTVSTGAKPLHPNHLLILEAIGQLQPASVHEVGCGGGDHVAHAKALYPEITVTGGDRGATQLELAKERHPEISADLGLQDITMPFSDAWPKADLVYTQAVVMHIHTAVSHFVALSNIVRAANKYVLLMENLQCHNFVDDILALKEGGHLDWDTLHLYRFDGSTGARAILLSKTELDLVPLTSDAQIRNGLKPSARRLKRSDEDSARGIFGFVGLKS